MDYANIRSLILVTAEIWLAHIAHLIIVGILLVTDKFESRSVDENMLLKFILQLFRRNYGLD
jgi:hypothetical protein